MKNEWIVVKHSYNEDSPNVGNGFVCKHERRVFRMSKRFMDSHNRFDDSYVPGVESFYWITHERTKHFKINIDFDGESAGYNPM